MLIISQESIITIFKYICMYDEKGGDGDGERIGPTTDTMGTFHEPKIKLLSLILITFSVSQRTLITNCMSRV